MATAAKPAALVRYEGGSIGTELWGGTQANFMVAERGEHLHEVAVLLTDAAAAYLAESLGRGDTPAFREAAGREAGQATLERLLAARQHVAPVVMLTRAMLEADPDVGKRLKKSLPK